MPPSSFEEQLARARVIERAFAAWLMQRGARILPVYDYSGLGDGKAPKLQAFSASDSLVTPDLLVARKGALVWCEVKWKARADWTKITGEFDTGISRRLWRQYQHVRAVTGARVFLVFAHEAEDVVTCDEIGALEALGPRIYTGEKMGRGGMVFWPLRRLHPLASYRSVFVEAA